MRTRLSVSGTTHQTIKERGRKPIKGAQDHRRREEDESNVHNKEEPLRRAGNLAAALREEGRRKGRCQLEADTCANARALVLDTLARHKVGSRGAGRAVGRHRGNPTSRAALIGGTSNTVLIDKLVAGNAGGTAGVDDFCVLFVVLSRLRCAEDKTFAPKDGVQLVEHRAEPFL